MFKSSNLLASRLSTMGFNAEIVIIASGLMDYGAAEVGQNRPAMTAAEFSLGEGKQKRFPAN